ncbi:hypothetical protein DRO53_03525 [Candidatus Bathyarchaeota archaeon]|nr:MAG: hypothetical protein DRO53_03525 [Candidatus Bathyarchaeota archaeon]
MAAENTRLACSGGLKMEKPTVFLIPVASPIHREKVSSRILKARKTLEKENIKVFGPLKPVVSVEEAPLFNPEEYDAVVVFIASGGASSLAAELASGKRWLLWAYDENNSLPSALSAKEKMEARNLWRGKLLYGSLDHPPSGILAEAQASSLLRKLSQLTLLLFTGDERKERFKSEAEEISRIFGIKTVFYSFEGLKETLNRFPQSRVEDLLRERLRKAEILELETSELEKPLRLYLAMREIASQLEASTLTIDCFSFIVQNGFTPCLALSLLNDDGIPALCEADLAALPLYVALAEASGRPTWIANLSKVDFKESKVTLAHCTAPYQLAEHGSLMKVRSHFETGAGAALDVPLAKGEVTLAHLSLKPLRLTVASGNLVESQLGNLKLCRTQAEIEISGNPETLLKLSGNHQVLAYGNLKAVLVSLGEQIGAETVEI